MPDGDSIEVEGKIVSVLPGTMFRVELANGHQVLAHISGKLRKHFIKIAAGDTVKMEMSPYDLERLGSPTACAPRLPADLGVAPVAVDVVGKILFRALRECFCRLAWLAPW